MPGGKRRVAKNVDLEPGLLEERRERLAHTSPREAEGGREGGGGRRGEVEPASWRVWVVESGAYGGGRERGVDYSLVDHLDFELAISVRYSCKIDLLRLTSPGDGRFLHSFLLLIVL